MAPGRSYRNHIKIILIKIILEGGGTMLTATPAAISQILKEVESIDTEVETPYIRLHMGVG